MSFTNETTHYGLPQWIGSDKPTYLVDQNNAYQKIDAEIYNANTTAGAAQTAAEGAVETAGAASSTAADALTAAQTASSTADNALQEAQTANTNAQSAQTAAGAAQTAAQAAQEAAAGNSITNLAPAYDPTITYAVDDLVTADGKLYKCIVAVTSPEQFDINKWDDVTTSEIYARAGYYRVISYNNSKSVAADTSKTHSQFIDYALSSLANSLSNELSANQRALIKTIRYKYSYFVVVSNNYITHNSTDFGRVEATSISDDADYMYMQSIKHLNGAADMTMTAIKHSDNSVTYSNLNNTSSSSSGFEITYDIVTNA